MHHPRALKTFLNPYPNLRDLPSYLRPQRPCCQHEVQCSWWYINPRAHRLFPFPGDGTPNLLSSWFQSQLRLDLLGHLLHHTFCWCLLPACDVQQPVQRLISSICHHQFDRPLASFVSNARPPFSEVRYPFASPKHRNHANELLTVPTPTTEHVPKVVPLASLHFTSMPSMF